MVRSADISAKRRVAGAKGGAHTKLRWKDFQPVSRQLPQHLPLARDGPLTKERINRAAERRAVRTSVQPAAPEPAEPAQGQPRKRASDPPRAEREAAFAARKQRSS
jgi:hypothetical protein